MQNLKLIVLFALVLACPIGWGLNMYKLTGLDFEAPYKAEVLRVIGIVPPIGMVMGYITFDEEANNAEG